MSIPNLKSFLDERVERYNQPNFIENDPISIPHLFTQKQDIEIAGFFAAILAWGQRITIINKSKELMALMDNAPFDFIVNHSENDLKRFTKFKHRTFNSTDCLYFIQVLSNIFKQKGSLEYLFISNTIEVGIIQFHNFFFKEQDFPVRTKKHVATPEKNSACKRINMFLRWMVRSDGKGVDFGIWNRISPAQLVCPCDHHVERVARKLKLITRKPLDWKTAMELTENLKRLDAEDPVKYDFALFGLGIEEKF